MILPSWAIELSVMSAITPAVMAERGYRWVTDEDELLELGFRRYQARVPALLVPVHGVDGETVVHQIRPDRPRIRDGKEVKYDTPERARMRLDVPPRARAALADPAVPLYITEGAKKADAAVSCGACCISLLGVWSWRNGRGALGDWESVALRGRDVIVVFDSDVMRKREVQGSLERFAEFLASRGARVSMAYLPAGPDGGKIGLDDFLAMGHTMGDVADLATVEFRWREGQDALPNPPDPVGARPSPDDFFTGRGRFLLTRLGAYLLDLGHVRVDRGQHLWRYREGVFLRDGEAWARREIVELLGERWRAAHAAETVVWLKDHARLIDVENPPQKYINVLNGLLDWRTGELRDHDPETVFTFQIPHRWVPGATCPKIDEFVNAIIPADAVEFTYEVIGYGLLPGNPFQKAVLLTGPGGNGKSQLLTVISELLGRENVSSVSLHDLAENKWSAAELVGRLANICGDIDRRGLKRTDLFKKITGDDVVTAERKRGHPFQFRAICVPIFSANEEPGTPDQTDAWWDRWVRIPMLSKIRGTEREVPRIGARLAADREEMEGLLVRAVGSLRTLMERGQFGLPESVAGANEEARRTLDTVIAFVEERCVLDPEAWTKRESLYTTYKSWITDGGQFALGRTNFYKRLFHEFGERRGLISLGKNRDGDLGWRGIRLRGPGDGDGKVGEGGENQLCRHEGAGQGHGGVDDGKVGGENPSSDNSLLAPRAKPLIRGEKDVVERFSEEIGFRSNFAVTSVALDLETAGVEHLWSYGQGFVRLIGYQQDGRVTLCTDPAELPRNVTFVGHNLFGFDLLALARWHGLDLATVDAVDTKLLAFLHDPPAARMNEGQIEKHYSLDWLGDRLFGIGKDGDLKKLAREFGGFDRIPVEDERYRSYLIRDVELTAKLAEHYPLTDYARREHEVARRAAIMSVTGFRVDEELLRRRVEKGRAVRAQMLERLKAYGLPDTRKDGSPCSAPQSTEEGRAAIVRAFEDLGVTLPRTPAGQPALDQKAMAEVIETNPRARALAETIKSLNGVRSVYETVERCLVDGRVHPMVNLRQATGRWSVTEPGLTVMGKRNGRYVEREIFLAEPGHVLIAVDLAQVDARAVAALSQDHAYLELFEPGRDAHREIAIRVWGDAGRREDAKVIGHGWNYGMGINGLMKNAKVDETTALQFDQAMREQFPDLVRWRKEVREKAKSGELLDNGFGRMMRPDPQRAHTQGPALMGQGAARDILMQGLLNMPMELIGMMRAVVHDEVVLSVPADMVDDVERAVARAMSFLWAPVEGSRPVAIEAGLVGRGVSWGAVYDKEVDVRSNQQKPHKDHKDHENELAVSS